MTIPELLKHRAPLRHVVLKGLAHYHVDDDTGEVYSVRVWARPVADGWEGWYRQEAVTLEPPVTWLKELWQEIGPGDA